MILPLYGEDKGWDWLRRLAANTGLFTARSRDVPTVVAKGEFAAGFAVPCYMAFEEKLAGFDLKFVAPKNAFVTPEPMAILAGARNRKAARAFIEFLLTERGQKVFMERGLFPITPKYKVQGPPGSTAELAVEFTGGVRSYFDGDVSNVYDEDDRGQAVGRAEDAVPLRDRGEVGGAEEEVGRNARHGHPRRRRREAVRRGRPRWTTRISPSRTASSSRCSARRAAGRRRCCACSRASTSPTRARSASATAW